MIIQLKEHEGCFAFEMKAETKEDAALVARFGMNATKAVRHISAYASQDGVFGASLVLPKNKSANSFIPRRQ